MVSFTHSHRLVALTPIQHAQSAKKLMMVCASGVEHQNCADRRSTTAWHWPKAFNQVFCLRLSVPEDFNWKYEICIRDGITSEETQTWWPFQGLDITLKPEQYQKQLIISCVGATCDIVCSCWFPDVCCTEPVNVCIHTCFYEHDNNMSWSAGWTDVFHQHLCCKHV